MASITNRLYLINIKYHTVAIIPAKDPLKAINKYIARTGFATICTYFYSRLMATATTINTKISNINEYCFAAAYPKTIGGSSILMIESYEIKCDDIFKMADPTDINNPLFVRPTTKDVRNCNGFSNIPEHELRKFCL